MNRTIRRRIFLQRQAGAVVKGLLAFLFLIVIGAGVLLFMFGTVVPPGAMGVRQIKFGPGQGFAKNAVGPGLYWSVPFYSTVHIVPKTLQLLHFNREPEPKQERETFSSLEIQSADRGTVDVDLSVLYRFYDAPSDSKENPHGGPADLFKLGISDAAWVNEVRRRTEDQLKRNLGVLHTAKFYDPEEREERIEVAQQKANEALAPSGIKIEALLLRRFTYRESSIDNAIFQKNLQEQDQRRNEALAHFTEVEGLVKKVEAERTADIDTINVQAESNVRVIRSEGDLFEAQKKAEADLLVAKAQAAVDKAKADALAQMSGAKVYIGREIAPLLTSLKGGIISDIDPYDLQAWSKRLGVEEAK